MNNSRRRCGFTLLELVLTIAILVAVSALVVPMLGRPMAWQRMRKGSDQVRATWGSARVEAMTTGLIHSFRYVPGTGDYQLEVWEGFDPSLEMTTDLGFTGETPVVSRSALPGEDLGMAPGVISKRLPDGILFLGDNIEQDVRAEQAIAQQDVEASIGLTGPSWSVPILFYPDGTTSDASLTLINDYQEQLSLELRGLTGVSLTRE